LLYSFQYIFAYFDIDITKCNLLKCEILTYPDAKPVRCRPYRLSDEMRGHVDKQLDELLAAGVIRPDEDSAFASPIVMVKKRNDSFRFCVNMRY